MLRTFVFAIAVLGAIGLTASSTPASARIAAGAAAPMVETNKVDVRCHHHRYSSRFHCPSRHPHWHHRHYWHAQPFYWQPYYHHHRWHSRRHWHW
ncbi:MAG: hypothetical protein KGZ73_11275 [Rhizobiales bacterium]|nr:hypothetical protein [Hyphomicrobiales bacterium]